MEVKALESLRAVVERWQAIVHAAWHLLDNQEDSQQDPALLKAVSEYMEFPGGDIHDQLSLDAAWLKVGAPRAIRDWALEDAAKIAEQYGQSDAARDIRAMKSKAATPPHKDG
jgi:hypothetical protein